MSQAQVTQGKIKIGRLTRDRLESSKAWLDQLPNDRWFIQIFAADATRHAEVESLLRKLPPRETTRSTSGCTTRSSAALRVTE
jgi:hypothetical protein